MSKIILIHGAYGYPEENWLPWLKKELEKLGHSVSVPKFPTPENQTLDNWNAIMKDYVLDEETIVVAHSLGVAFLLSLLEKHKIKAAFLVSGFISLLGNEKFDIINSTFIEREFVWNKIVNNCFKFCLIHSDNDPYVPIEKAYELSKNLETELIIVPNAGHFHSETFELLLEKMEEET